MTMTQGVALGLACHRAVGPRRPRRPRRELAGRLRDERQRELRDARRNLIAPRDPHARLERGDAIDKRQCAEVVVH